ncbi:hypothetical protein CBS11350_5985 [Aspergillus niger]|nr:hypothetical protein CBS11350_5985 [Aspergillus niger]
MNSFMGQNILEIREQPCPSQRKRIQNRMAQRKFREKAKARKQSHPPYNQTSGIGNGKSHDGPSNLPSSTIDPEPHDNGMLGIPDQDVQYNQNTFEGAAFTLPESNKDTPHSLQTSNVEEQLRAFRFVQFSPQKRNDNGGDYLIFR